MSYDKVEKQTDGRQEKRQISLMSFDSYFRIVVQFITKMESATILKRGDAEKPYE